MHIAKVFDFFSQIENTTKRLEMQSLLVSLYEELSPTEAAIVSYLLLGRIVPEFVQVEFQLSDKSLTAIVERLLQREVKEDLTKLGDIGTVWESAGKSETQVLSVEEYYQQLWDIALLSGHGSQQKKQDMVATLLQKVSLRSGRYTLRILNGKLRLGASDRTVLDGLGKAHGASYAEALRQLYEQTSDLGHTIQLFKQYREDAFTKGAFLPGIPVSSKLVERADSINAIFERISHPIEEPKYDGLRIQVHVCKASQEKDSISDRVWGKRYSESMQSPDTDRLTLFSSEATEEEWKVELFSRNLGNMTEMFPEVVAAAKQLPEQYFQKHGEKVDSLVLDGEVIGYNDIVQEYLPFQQTMTRKRKHDIGSAADVVPVKVFVFDILLVDGKDKMKLPLQERKILLTFLDEHRELQQTIVKTPVHYPTSVVEAEKIFMEYVSEGLEGVIFKEPTSVYTPGTRNFDWLKFKKAMKKDLADTVDVVLLGYYRGEGKLSAFGIGALLAGVYDREQNTFLTATKIGTGVTHEQWKDIKKACDAVRIEEKPDYVVVPKTLLPDVWLRPEIVVEVEADEITKSPLHTSGYALRFPRFKKFREKKAEQATTTEELKSLA